MKYYDNSHLCAECTGAGCKQCYDPLNLKAHGSEIFPLSYTISGCTPPHIQNNYATKLKHHDKNRIFIPSAR